MVQSLTSEEGTECSASLPYYLALLTRPSVLLGVDNGTMPHSVPGRAFVTSEHLLAHRASLAADHRRINSIETTGRCG